jgi:hypothetical protein
MKKGLPIVQLFIANVKETIFCGGSINPNILCIFFSAFSAIFAVTLTAKDSKITQRRLKEITSGFY